MRSGKAYYRLSRGRNNVFLEGVITPFIKCFHAQQLQQSTLRTLAMIKTVNLIYISTTYLAQTFDLHVRMFTRLH